MKQTPKRTRLLAFLPAAIIIGVVAGTAAGISLIPSATAADIVVTGSVTATISTPPTPPTGPGLNDGSSGSCDADAPVGGGAADFAIPNGWDAAAQRTGICRIEFASSNGQANLMFESANSDGRFYCNNPAAVRTCGTVNGVSNVGAGAAITANTFGIALENTITNATAGADVVEDGNNDALTGDSSWYPIPDNGGADQLCRSSASGTATCDFRLGVRGQGAGTQANGNYSGTLVLTAVGV